MRYVYPILSYQPRLKLQDVALPLARGSHELNNIRSSGFPAPRPGFVSRLELEVVPVGDPTQVRILTQDSLDPNVQRNSYHLMVDRRLAGGTSTPLFRSRRRSRANHLRISNFQVSGSTLETRQSSYAMMNDKYVRS